MQRYINISPHRDILGGDTISIYTRLGRIDKSIYSWYRYIEYCDILMYRHQNVYLYIQPIL